MFRDEVILGAKQSPFTSVELFEVIEEADYFKVIIEFMPKGTLDQLMKGKSVLNGGFTWVQTANIALQLLATLSFSEDTWVYHRDLKPENLFIESINGNIIIIKIADYGLGVWAAISASDQCGTAIYMAPQQILKISAGQEIDTHAVGVITYQFLTADLPF